MKAVFVLREWRDSRLQLVKRDDIAEGLFTEGQTFNGSIFLEFEDEIALKEALGQGYYLVLVMNRP